MCHALRTPSHGGVLTFDAIRLLRSTGRARRSSLSERYGRLAQTQVFAAGTGLPSQSGAGWVQIRTSSGPRDAHGGPPSRGGTCQHTHTSP